MINSGHQRLNYTGKRFSDALADLLRREAGDPHARINLREFFGRVKGWEYETLRKQIAGERALKPEAIEAMAAALGVAPEYFQEYRRYQTERAIAKHPELVDLLYDLVVDRAKSLDAIAVPLISVALDDLAAGTSLDADRASRLADLLMDGQVGDIQAAGLLTGLRVKGETSDEIFGFARAMRRRGAPVRVTGDEPLVDIVSTGGDRLATFNISTTAAFVAAGAGVRVAKHGSRGQTSHSGSADLIQALGARIDLSPDRIAACIEQVGIGFMSAPLHYGPVRQLVPLRRSLNTRTIFNFISPILNPAGAKRQLTGVSDIRYMPSLAEALGQLGSEHALFAHGEDGLDEISISGPTTLIELRDGVCSQPFTLTPEDVGLERWPLKSLVGGDPIKNAEITRRVLAGESGGPLNVVLLNAGAAIHLAGKADSIRGGVELAREAVVSGKAWGTMDAFIEFTRANAS